MDGRRLNDGEAIPDGAKYECDVEEGASQTHSTLACPQ
jgi:hypothetical protein